MGLVVLMLATAACNDEPGSPDADAETDTGRDDGTDVDPDACTPDRMCHADFPCTDRSFCSDERTVVQCENVHCSSPRVCGTSCCEGGSCLPSLDPPTNCPEGERCFENPEGNPSGFGGPGRTALCLPEPDEDGGTDGDVDYDGYAVPDEYQPHCR